MVEYDYLVVGAGLFGATMANLLHAAGKKVLVIDRRRQVAGNVYTEKVEGINVHRYGAHIFHTDNREVWDYVNRFAEFNRYTNAPIARFRDELYNLPFNMNTFAKIWDDVVTPDDAKRHIEAERKEVVGVPKNLEEQAISLVGRTIYEKLIKEYTEKQWGRDCKDLPVEIIKRLPVRFVYDNNYFNDRYQGVPIGGYTAMVERMLDGIEVRLGIDFLDERTKWQETAHKIVYTGALDEYFDTCLGELGYRSLRFETEILDTDNFQGNAVVNYTGHEVDYTRVIEHKHFENTNSKKTVVTYEYPSDYVKGAEKYYTINDERNNAMAAKYRALAKQEKKVIFGGRLAEYKYYDMDDVIASAFAAAKAELSNYSELRVARKR